MPKRIQMSRQKPWRADNPDAVIVARPSKWGNPFPVLDGGREVAVKAFRVHAVGVAQFTLARIREELAGRDLACWCPLDEPCHADVLLEIANGGDS